ncbi:MAG: four helix bundle protein [Deltaproteobacteria bacterium]|nr:four helix bundle protein [Deltaproteobacteria bacterium]
MMWEKSYHFCLEIYKVFTRFPQEERFALTSQVRERPHLCFQHERTSP